MSLITIESKNKDGINRPVVCFIPGGPGLSSKTLRSMDVLSRSFDLAYIDPPGTGGQPEIANPTFASILASLNVDLKKLGSRKIILCGHSFGALYAIELAMWAENIAGILLMASPLSNASYEVATKLYSQFMTPELSQAEEGFDKKPSAETFTKLLASYGHLYFSKQAAKEGSQMLLNDSVSYQSFLHLLPILSKRTSTVDFVKNLRSLNLPKYMLAGSEDLLFPIRTLAEDASESKAKLFKIQDAGHFITFDQPEAVAVLIENFFVDSKV